MKTPAFWMTLAFLLTLPATPGAQGSNRFLDLSVAELATVWLLRNCGVDDEPRLEAAIVRRADELVPVFERAWETGPTEALVKSARGAAERRFERNRAALENGSDLGLAKEDLERARTRTRERYDGRALQSLEIGYRSQALRGLYLGGGEVERRLVEQVARDDRSVYGETARRLLEKRR